MTLVTFQKAYYIKLGAGGTWEKSSIDENKIRLGWSNQSLDDINQHHWSIIGDQLAKESKTSGVATRDLNALRWIVESRPSDIWIAFYNSRLWWCHPGDAKIYEDATSKYRKVDGIWSSTDTAKHELLINQIPGSITKVQRFQGTVCHLDEDAIEDLKRLLNNQPSAAYRDIIAAKEALELKIADGLKKLHWKDFEILVDLLFQNAGWRRMSLVGESMKYVDIELVEPVTGEMYQVQVKSTATLAQFEEYAKDFSGGSYRKLYFVVHSPTGGLTQQAQTKYTNVEILLPDRLAAMVVDFGLTGWLLKKIR